MNVTCMRERERARERTCLINVSVHPPSSSQIGHCKHSPKILHKDDSAGAEVGSDGDIEASIAIEKSGVAPIQRDTLQQKTKKKNKPATWL